MSDYIIRLHNLTEGVDLGSLDIGKGGVDIGKLNIVYGSDCVGEILRCCWSLSAERYLLEAEVWQRVGVAVEAG